MRFFKRNTDISKVKKGRIGFIASVHFELNERKVSVVNFNDASVDDVNGFILLILYTQF